MLYLPSTDFGSLDPARPALQAGLWAQYLLDSAANVTEALALLDGVQLVMVETRGSKASVHVALEDARCDSAIIEYILGKQVLHRGHAFRLRSGAPVMTLHPDNINLNGDVTGQFEKATAPF